MHAKVLSLAAACAIALSPATKDAAAADNWSPFQWLEEQGMEMIHVYPGSGKGHDVNDTMAAFEKYRGKRDRIAEDMESGADQQAAEPSALEDAAE